MDMNEYQRLAARTINRTLSTHQITLHALFGMASEVGEIHGLFQKEYQGHAIEENHLKKELGDVLWFVAEFASANGWDLEEIAQLNVDKLRARYPAGFEAEKSVHRAAGDE